MADNKVETLITAKDNTKFGTEQAKKNIRSVGKETQSLNTQVSSLGAGFESALKKFAPLGIGAAIKQTTSKVIEATKKSADYIETLNVLDVAFDSDTKSIREFTSNIADTLNLDDSTLIKAAATFKTLANSMGYANDTGEQFSKLLTQMTLDISSLYNIDFSKARSALQYAVEGQGKTLKALTGASVLETTIQTTLDTLGVDAYVEDMTDAEKAMARVIAITYQLQNSQGDLARTIESPANQFRILGEQVSMAARQVGNIFLPAVAALLPYLNAIVIVINKVLGAIASLFGFSENAWDSFEGGANTFDDLSDSIGGVGSSLGGVGKAAKKADNELKGLRGFDKLNNLTTPKDTGGSGGGGGGGGGFNPKLLKAFSDMFGRYNSMLDGVKTKATQIAEAFMEWAKVLIPLQKPLKELAGLTYDGLVYVWNNVLKPLGSWVAWQLIPQAVKTIAAYLELVYQVGKKLFNIYKTLYETILQPFARVIGKTIISILKDMEKAFNFIAKNEILTNALALYTAFKQLKTILGLVAKIKIKNIVVDGETKGVLTLGKYVKDLKSNLLDGVKGIKDWKKVWTNFLTLVSPAQKNLTTEMTKTQKAGTYLKNVFNSLKTAALGAIAAFGGFKILTSAFDDIKKNGPTIGNVLGAVAGAFLLIGGAIVTVNAILPIFGSTIQAIGTSLLTNPIFLIASAVTAIGIALTGVISSTKEYNNELDRGTKITDTNLKKLSELRDEASKQIKTSLAQIERGQDYKAILLDTLDAEGKVRDGEQDRAEHALANLNKQLGTNYKLEDGLIKTEDGLRVSRELLNAEIDNTILKLKTEAYMEAFKDEYIQALKSRRDAYIALNAKIDESNKQLQSLDEQVKRGDITAKQAADRAVIWEQQKIDANKDYQNALATTNDSVKRYEDLQAAYASDSSEKMQNAIKQFGYTTEKVNENNVKSTDKSTKQIYNDYLSKYTGATNEVTAKVNSIPTQKTLKVGVDSSAVDNFISVIDTKIGNKRYKMTTSVDGVVNLQKYAVGGLPNVGQMFIANERGPELVGQIGGQSFVANQNQMMSLLDKKLSNAGGLQNATFNIQVGSEEVAHLVLNNLNEMAKSNGKPITING